MKDKKVVANTADLKKSAKKDDDSSVVSKTLAKNIVDTISPPDTKKIRTFEYPFLYGPAYNLDPPPKEKSFKPDYSILPDGKYKGNGLKKMIDNYQHNVLDKTQRKDKITVRREHLSDDFLNATFDEQLESFELENVPLKSAIAIQKGLFHEVTTSEKQAFILLKKRIANDDGFLVHARLQNLHINDFVLKYLSSGFARNTRIKYLMLHHNDIRDDGLEILCQALRWHPNLHTIWLGANKITDTGVRYLSLLLTRNAQIKEVNISNKWPSHIYAQEQTELHPSITYIGAEYLGNALATGSTQLTSLSLSHQRVYDDGAIALFQSLPKSCLRTLNLAHNGLTSRCCHVLCTVFMQNPLLEQLILTKNEIADEGGIELAHGLAYNTNLHSLDISYNHLLRDGLYALYKTLDYNYTLTSLHTVGNMFVDQLAEEKVSRRNKSMCLLGLQSSGIGEDVAGLGGKGGKVGMIRDSMFQQMIEPEYITDEFALRKRILQRNSVLLNPINLRRSLLHPLAEEKHALSEDDWEEQLAHCGSAELIEENNLSRKQQQYQRRQQKKKDGNGTGNGTGNGEDGKGLTTVVFQRSNSFVDMMKSPFQRTHSGTGSFSSQKGSSFALLRSMSSLSDDGRQEVDDEEEGLSPDSKQPFRGLVPELTRENSLKLILPAASSSGSAKRQGSINSTGGGSGGDGSSGGSTSSPMLASSPMAYSRVPGVTVHGRKATLMSIAEDHVQETQELMEETSQHILWHQQTMNQLQPQAPQSIQSALAEAIQFVNNLDDEDARQIITRTRSTNISFTPFANMNAVNNATSGESKVTDVVPSSPSSSSALLMGGELPKSPSRRTPEIRKSQDLGKILGVPKLPSMGIKPIRTSISATSDSGNHLMYLRVSTAADEPHDRPVSIIKIALDQRAERKKTEQARQDPLYKAQKALKMTEFPKLVHQEAAISRLPDRFWRDSELRSRYRYPKGIDLADGCTSTKLEPVVLPSLPPPDDVVGREYYSKFDRTDPGSAWNRYLNYQANPKLSYQKHLGFGQKNFAAGQILAARKKENTLQKVAKMQATLKAEEEEEEAKQKEAEEQAKKEKKKQKKVNIDTPVVAQHAS